MSSTRPAERVRGRPSTPRKLWQRIPSLHESEPGLELDEALLVPAPVLTAVDAVLSDGIVAVARRHLRHVTNTQEWRRREAARSSPTPLPAPRMRSRFFYWVGRFQSSFAGLSRLVSLSGRAKRLNRLLWLVSCDQGVPGRGRNAALSPKVLGTSKPQRSGMTSMSMGPCLLGCAISTPRPSPCRCGRARLSVRVAPDAGRGRPRDRIYVWC